MHLMEDIWKLFQGLYIYDCRHVYKEANRTADRLAKKELVSWSLVFGSRTSLKMSEILVIKTIMWFSFQSIL